MASSKAKKSTKRTNSKAAAARSGSKSRRRTASGTTGKDAARLAQEEQRAMEVRRDIRLLIFMGAMVFLMLAVWGLGGVAGRSASYVMFGLFGRPAYVLPVFLFFAVVFVISNMGKRTLPARTASLIMLFVCACTAFELWSGEPSRSAQYNPAEVFQRCAASKEGGGLIGGTAAFGMFRYLRGVGSAFVLVLIILICVMIFTQFSPVERYRRAQEERIRRGDPSFMERRRLRAQEKRAAAAVRREEVVRERARRRKEREELLEQEEKNREERLQKLKEKTNAADLVNNVIEPEPSRSRSPRKDGSLVQNRPSLQEQPYFEEEKPLNEEKPVREGKKPERTQEKVVTGTPHGIRFLDRGKREQEKAEEIRVSAPVVSDDGSEISERILRPDANTVRVESEGLVQPASEMRDLYGGPYAPGSGRGTMTVFTRTTDTGSIDEDLHFPFYQEENEKHLRKVYASESAADKILSGSMDIADAGGMSTFWAQSADADAPASVSVDTAPEPERAPVDDRTEDVQKAEPALPAEETPSAVSAAAEKEPEKAGTAAVKNKESTPAISATQEDLDGIEVHRERGGPAGSGKRTVMSGEKRNAENRKYSFPPFHLMEKGQPLHSEESDQELKETAFRLQETLRIFGVNVSITDISQGPSITRYELQPEQGVKVSKILSLANDIKLSLAATDIRIEAPIPGKPAIGIEVPNKHRSVVALRDILESREFRTAKSLLTFAVGKDVGGKTIVADIAKMPHVLIAGATGSGKSVCINTIIMSILYKASPDEVQMIMIDPKVVELSVYNGIPHLMIPVVTDVKKSSAALNWAVAEMERRYKLFAAAGTRDLAGYNAMVKAKGSEAGENEKPLSRIVVIVDELADLMMVCKNDVETSICRLAQLARAAGLHLIIATQRPSVDVITGLIKANMPSRIAFAVASNTDSRTILDMNGAEKLIGKGDMLFYPQNYQKPARYQGAFVSDQDVQNVVEYIKENNHYDTNPDEIGNVIDQMAVSGMNGTGLDAGGDSGYDEYFEKAGRFIIEKNKASIGMLQRVLKIGFNRAARIMDQLAEAGVVSEDNGTRARQVLMDMTQFEQFLEEM